LYKGVINDPYNEFFIEEREGIWKDTQTSDFLDAFWEEKYAIRKEMLPG